jgi:hypothetical protein
MFWLKIFLNIGINFIPTKTTKTKKKAVKSNPPNPETVIQPEEIDDITNFDIRDNHDGSYVDEPEVT